MRVTTVRHYNNYKDWEHSLNRRKSLTNLLSSSYNAFLTYKSINKHIIYLFSLRIVVIPLVGAINSMRYCNGVIIKKQIKIQLIESCSLRDSVDIVGVANLPSFRISSTFYFFFRMRVFSCWFVCLTFFFFTYFGVVRKKLECFEKSRLPQ